jgi:predicted nucleic acid-binding Zn ribbon protein
MWTSIQKIIPRKVKELGLEQAMSLAKLQKDWDEILKPTLPAIFKKKSEPIKIYHRVLFVRCQNSVWAAELQIKEKIILEEIKKWQRDLSVQKIKFFA